ncbi:Protein lifeguard 2 [Caenorhabditis elegans]|uniref:Protein lifeguard 2 n=1 Tax=Caenorhabditis elegans TaxID=6239 RepID=Q23396_CAEEL|nr:Protein lifeguard 2 [Caenorhabditis elegans]CAA94224.2 Protein lifeguard 2 [Caenorhabditis elegans]|eukprot:NP_510303.2 Uncharacterized protein CELE_ZK1086.2 [Caenorhabditis elegans]
MPVERVPTPCQIPPIWERNAEMFEDARNFIEYVSTYLAKDFYKLTLYAYTVLLAFFIAIIEARHYDFKQMGDTIFILAIFVLFCMGATCSFTFFAMTCRHALFLVPLLFLQVFVLLYGITNYFCPFVLTNEAPMKADMDMESSDIAKWIFCAKMVIYSVFRVTPLLVHFLLTMITIKSVGCMMIVQVCGSNFVLKN